MQEVEMTFDELEKTARPGDTAMVKATRSRHGGWDLGNTRARALVPGDYLLGVEAHHYTPAPRVKVRRAIEVAREDVREGDWALDGDGAAYLLRGGLPQEIRDGLNFSDPEWRFERVLSEEVE